MVLRAVIAAALLMPSAAFAQTENLTIEQRVRQLEDREAIRDLILAYAVRLDARDFDGYVDLFAENGVWQNGATLRRGRGEIRQMLVGIYGEQAQVDTSDPSYRIVSNVEIALDGDRATAQSRQLTIMRGEGGAPNPVLSGIYEDQLIREDGEWKILHRTDRVVMPTPEEWRRRMAELRPAR
jgi:uncharacterized protein (TIGR02246 family)